MTLRSLLKSPSVIGGTSLASAGGAGVGGGQIYEEVNPTVDKQLSRQGYFYSPIQATLEEDSTDEKFTGSNWGCIEKLFLKIGVNLEFHTSKTHDANDETDNNLLTVPTVDNDLVACAMMDLRPITLSEKHKNRIYFKSEVVVKGKDYGWAIGTGLSTVPSKKQDQTYFNDINFEYNLLLFKKGNNQRGEVDVGYSWYNFYQQTVTAMNFFIKTPHEEGLTNYNYNNDTDINPLQPKSWAGVARVDASKNPQNQDLLQGIHVYVDGLEYAEFFGNNGNFPGNNDEGFTKVHQVYVSEGDVQGWRKIPQSNKYKDLSSSLKAWYAPFKDKKLQGTNLKDIQDQCYDGSTQRNHKSSNLDPLLRDVCYGKS